MSLQKSLNKHLKFGVVTFPYHKLIIIQYNIIQILLIVSYSEIVFTLLMSLIRIWIKYNNLLF